MCQLVQQHYAHSLLLPVVRDHRDGWGNTLAPISTVEMVFLNGMVARRRKNKKKGPGAGDEQGRIDAFLGAA